MTKMIIRNLCLGMMIMGSATAEPAKRTLNPAAVSPIIMKMRKSYTFIYEGVSKDFPKYQRYLKLAEGKAKKAKTPSAQEKYTDIIKMLKDMIAAHQSIDNMFNGIGRSMEFENALRKIPDLESRLRLDAKIDVDRDWLTPDEVRQRAKAGWRYRNCPAGVLPYSQKIWYKPKDGRTN